jgi:glycosyltransferase involved in cell wall biosynthesis
MKIAYLTTEYPHPRIKSAAGIGTSIRNLAEALVTEGHEPVIVVANQETTEIFTENGITFHFIKKNRYSFLSFYRQRRFLQKYISKHAKIEGWDVLEAPDWTGLTAFMKLRLPVVIRLHGTDTYFSHLENRPLSKKYFWLEKIALHGADAYISPTFFTAQLSATLFNIKQSKIEVIPHGLHLTNFINSDPTTFERGLLLYAGTLIRKKGVLELPEIFK